MYRFAGETSKDNEPRISTTGLPYNGSWRSTIALDVRCIIAIMYWSMFLYVHLGDGDSRCGRAGLVEVASAMLLVSTGWM
jgi:hypothetical protein